MRQLSLIDDIAQLAGALPAIKAAMRAVAGDPEGAGRKALPEKINAIARASGIKLTGGNARAISEDTLHKWLSPSDESHPPSIHAVLAFYLATGSDAPLRAMLQSVGLDVMTKKDKKLRDLGEIERQAKDLRKRRRMLEDDL